MFHDEEDCQTLLSRLFLTEMEGCLNGGGNDGSIGCNFPA
jgi:hypothetical protein